MGIIAAIKEFYEDHKDIIKAVGFGLGGAAVGGALVYCACSEERANVPSTPAQIPASNADVKAVHDDILTRNWKESYRENWNKVNAFAKHLELEDGEEYYLTGPNTWAGQTDKIIVSHLVYGDCAYPPKEDSDNDETDDD